MGDAGKVLGEGVAAAGLSRRRRSEGEWRELLEAWVASGDSVPVFCRREVVNACQFYAWRRRLRIGGVRQRRQVMGAEGEALAAGFLEAVVVEKAGASGSMVGSGLEVILSNGRLIRVAGGFDPDLLRRLVQSLEAL